MADNKKDAFTFSDKIKNSKPAFNPFSKRASSKIGNNGKPRKTLFERTRRDAPFFIAALAALLMLPFLYKYSGNVGEGDPIVAPGMADTVFDPERFDFSPSTEDPSGEIAQLAGRDPLSLIKGWGSSDTENVRYDVDERDGLADYSASSRSGANRASSTSTRSTSYRKTAPAATRAAFKRSGSTPVTKINEMRGASLNARGGGNIGSRFGGQNLKQAANRNSADPVRNPTKPVSLQPLRAAGSPSRSYFGQDNVARARASRDALSKANAVEALKDAVFNPIGQGHVGGLGEGINGGGGPAGKMEHNAAFNGITPWWWNMMQQREQEKWNYRFHLWRDPWKEAVKAGGTKFFSCLLWNTDDGDMGKVFGDPGSAAHGEQCKVKRDGKDKQTYGDIAGIKADFSGACKDSNTLMECCDIIAAQKAYEGTKYEEASAGSDPKSWWQTKKDCWGFAGKNKKDKGGKKGKKDKGNKGNTDDDGGSGEKNNCESVKNPDFSTGISFIMEDQPADQSIVIVTVKNEIVLADDSKIKLCKGQAKGECVLGVQKGNELDWNAFVDDAKTVLKGLGAKASEEELFERLLFVRVEGYSGELPKDLGGLPVQYNSFKDDVLGKNFLKASKPVSCPFPAFQIKAHNPIVPKESVGGVLVYDKNIIDDPNTIAVSCKDEKTRVQNAAIKNPQDQKGRATGVRTFNAYNGLDEDTVQQLNEDLAEGETPFTWKATDNKATSTDKTTHKANGEEVLSPVPPDLTDDIEFDDEIEDIDDGLIDLLDFSYTISGILPKDKILDPQLRKAVEKGEKEANGRWQGCVADMDALGRKVVIAETKGVSEIYKQADALYQQANKDSRTTLAYGVGSVAGVLDALTILEANGTTTVSKNVACALAKTIGANSKDPHGTNAKDEDNNNMFGTFAAFVDANSSFFPGNKLANGDVDSRFHGCAGGEEVSDGPGSQYHYGHYNWSQQKVGDLKNKSYGPHGEYHSQDGRKPYEKVLADGVWGSFPLKALAKPEFRYRDSVSAQELRQKTNNGTIDDINRKEYYEAYKKVFWRSYYSCGYGEDETMEIKDLFAYIDILCKEGTQIKPTNAPNGEELKCALHQYLVSPVNAPGSL